MRSVDRAGWVEVIRGDDLDAWGGDEGWVDEDDSAGSAGRVGHLGSGVGGDVGAGRDGSGGQHGEAVGAGWNIDIAGVCAEGDASYEWGDGADLLAGGDEIDVDGTSARSLVDETECGLAGGCGLALVGES